MWDSLEKCWFYEPALTGKGIVKDIEGLGQRWAAREEAALGSEAEQIAVVELGGKGKRWLGGASVSSRARAMAAADGFGILDLEDMLETGIVEKPALDIPGAEAEGWVGRVAEPSNRAKWERCVQDGGMKGEPTGQVGCLVVLTAVDGGVATPPSTSSTTMTQRSGARGPREPLQPPRTLSYPMSPASCTVTPRPMSNSKLNMEGVLLFEQPFAKVVLPGVLRVLPH